METKICSLCENNIKSSDLIDCGCLICIKCQIDVNCKCVGDCDKCKYGIVGIYSCYGNFCVSKYGDPKIYCEDHACQWCELCDNCCIEYECIWNKKFTFDTNKWTIERLKELLDECDEDFNNKIQNEIDTRK